MDAPGSQDRIIFLGTPRGRSGSQRDHGAASAPSSEDPDQDINIYINSRAVALRPGSRSTTRCAS